MRALVTENFCYCGFNSRSCQLICFYLQFLHINLTKYSNEWRCNTLYQFFLGQNLAFMVIFDSLGSLVLESDPPKITGYGYFHRVIGIHILNQSRFWLQASFTEEKRQCHEGVERVQRRIWTLYGYNVQEGHWRESGTYQVNRACEYNAVWNLYLQSWKSRTSLVVLFLALWLVLKTRGNPSTNQVANLYKTSNDLVSGFPSAWVDCVLFST